MGSAPQTVHFVAFARYFGDMDAAAALRMAITAIAVFVVSVIAGVLLARSDSNTVEAQVPEQTTTTTPTAPTTSSTALSAEPVALLPTSTTVLPPVRDFADLFAELRGAVAAVDVVRCASNAQGTAFLVDSETALTAWHVVENAAEIALDFGEQRVEAAVIGQNSERDVAVLRLSAPVVATPVVPVAAAQVRVGEQVAAIGQRQDAPLAMTVGLVTSVDGQANVGDSGRDVLGIVQTDAAATIGTSGGPLINQRGELVGIGVVPNATSGTPGAVGGFAADIEGVRDELANWALNPEPVRPAFCIGEVDLNDIDQVAPELINAEVDAPQVLALQRTFAVYTQAINSGRADEAFNVLGPGIRSGTTIEAWTAGQETSKLWDWNIRSIQPRGDGLAVRSTVTSTQAAEDGFDGRSECTRWDLIHDMVLGEYQGREFWLIDGLTPGPNGLAVDCADWQPERVQRGRLNAPEFGEQAIVVDDFLAAGTIDAWTLLVAAPGDIPQTYSIVLTTADGDARLGITLTSTGGAPEVDPGDDGGVALGQSAELTFERQGRVAIEVGELLEELGGDYRLTITNITEAATAGDDGDVAIGDPGPQDQEAASDAAEDDSTEEIGGAEPVLTPAEG